MRPTRPRAALPASLLCVAAMLATPAYALHDIVIINQYAPPNGVQHLVSADPAANAKLDESPDTVTLKFSRTLREGQSTIKVIDMFGSPMTDETVSISGESMSATLPALSQGKYRVRWKAACMCDDPPISGDYTFTVTR